MHKGKPGQRNWEGGEGDEPQLPTAQQLADAGKELQLGGVVMVCGVAYIKAADGQLERLDD